MKCKITTSLISLIGLLLTLTCTVSAASPKDKAKAEKAYNDLLKIRFTTNKKNRLKDLEQLGALLLIDALDEIKYVKGKSIENKVNHVKGQLETIYKTDQPANNVDLAHQWILGKIDGEIFDYNKFAYTTKQAMESGQAKLDLELNLLNKDFKKIIKAIEKDLKKETMLPYMDDIKQLYGPVEECPVCLDEKPLIQFAANSDPEKSCTKPHICISCKRKMIKEGKFACPICGKKIEP